MESDAATVPAGYEDKAAERRRTKGSDNPYQKDDESASVNRYFQYKDTSKLKFAGLLVAHWFCRNNTKLKLLS